MFDLLTSLLARARSLFYDNSGSGIPADNVQEAIDYIVSTGAGQPFTALTDPVLNGITQSIIDNNGGVVITLTGVGNDQTLPTPTDITIAHKFTVINNDTSTNNINIIGVITVTLQPGEKVEFVYDGTAWIASEAEGYWLDDGTDVKLQNSTRNIDLQSGGLKDANVTTSVKLGSSTDTSLNTVKKDILGAINELELLAVFKKVVDEITQRTAGDNLAIKNSNLVDIHKVDADDNSVKNAPGNTVAEYTDADDNSQVKLNTIGGGYHKNNFGFGGITSPEAGIHNGKGVVEGETTVNTATYTLLITDRALYVTTTCTVTIPSALITPASGSRKFNVINVGSNTVTVETEGSETINGSASDAIITGAYDAVSFGTFDGNLIIE